MATSQWYPRTRGFGYLQDTGGGYHEDPVLDLANKSRPDLYGSMREKWLNIQRVYGTDRYMQDFQDELGNEDEADELVFEPDKQYRDWELTKLADQLLREDSKRELCRSCGEYGEETGMVESKPQFKKDGEPLLDEGGNQLYIEFPELECSKRHRWFLGEGKARGINGRAPILFKNHLDDRRRREIYTANGTPDPGIQRGMYNRTHPQGRKVNSDQQRKKNGASFFR